MYYDSTRLLRDARYIAPSLRGARICWKRGGMTIDATFCRSQYQVLGAAYVARLKTFGAEFESAIVAWRKGGELRVALW
jgi:hypothetical protein